MRIVIVTGTAAHQKHLCAALVPPGQVVGIIHPADLRPPLGPRVSRLLKFGRTCGWSLLFQHLLGKLTRPAATGRPPPAELDFSEAIAFYDTLPRSLIHPGCDVRTAEAGSMLAALRPDVVLFLGGPVYPKKFIEAAPLALNFHSGLSPLYNGTASIRLAFAHGHPHLCGGTLMVMSPTVDGGGILGHFLPQIRPGDTPESLFAKTVRGAAVMYERVTRALEAGGPPLRTIPQPPPLFYSRSHDLGWYHERMIARHLRSDLPARFARDAATLEYWRAESPEAADRECRATLDRLLWGRRSH